MSLFNAGKRKVLCLNIFKPPDFEMLDGAK